MFPDVVYGFGKINDEKTLQVNISYMCFLLAELEKFIRKSFNAEKGIGIQL